jgi:type IV pilus assembly protein PilM
MLTTPLRLPKLPAFLERWIADPPPTWVVEFSEEGIFRASPATPSDLRFEPLPAGALHASPVEHNLRSFDTVKKAVEALNLRPPGVPVSREIPVALLLPDYSVRTSILDFEDFPARIEEQEPLIRFRLRKIVPYDLETARLRFQSFAKQNGNGGVTVVASSCPIHVLAEYESLLRQQACHPGFVTSGALASLSLLPAQGVAMLAKRSGSVVTVAVLQDGILRLIRTVELSGLEWEELLSLLQPMFALVEDQLQVQTERLALCGFGDSTRELARALEQEFRLPVAELSSRFGTPQGYNAGALGYVQGLGEVVA